MQLEELKQLKRWVKTGGATGKRPDSVYESNVYGVQDKPQHWGTYAEAEKAREVFGGKGIGLVLGGIIAGVDFDHVRNPETGAITPEAAVLIDVLDTYTEVSMSGTGLHCYMLVDPQKVGYLQRSGSGNMASWTNPYNDGKAAGLEFHHPALHEGGIVEGAKFYVFTGDVYKGRDIINDRTDEFLRLCDKYAGTEASVLSCIQ